MNRTKAIALFVFLACSGLLGFALYLQIVLDMLPCPLCVMQRYAFAIIGLLSLVVFISPKTLRFTSGLSILVAIAGAGIATYQLWVIAQPPGSCGADPFAPFLNRLIFAEWFPTLFQAIGFCETPYDPILGLSIPSWALIWFLAFFVAAIVLLKTHKQERVFFGKIRH